jgi:glycosyltransferase involved in cell wall biosynthesis
LKTGFARAQHDVVVITDGDGTYPEAKIADLLARIDDGAEMAVGSRTGADVHIPLVRRPAKAFLRWLASYLAGTNIPDLNSGLRAMRRELVLRYRPILPDGFSFTTTITLASLTNDHRVDYVPIDYAKRSGRSKIRPIRDTLGFTQLIVRTVLYFNPLKVLYPVAGLVLVALLVSLYYDAFVVSPPNLSDKTTCWPRRSRTSAMPRSRGITSRWRSCAGCTCRSSCRSRSCCQAEAFRRSHAALRHGRRAAVSLP